MKVGWQIIEVENMWIWTRESGNSV